MHLKRKNSANTALLLTRMLLVSLILACVGPFSYIINTPDNPNLPVDGWSAVTGPSDANPGGERVVVSTVSISANDWA